MTFETCLLFMLYVDYGFNIINIYYIAKSIGCPLIMNRFDYFSNFYSVSVEELDWSA